MGEIVGVWVHAADTFLHAADLHLIGTLQLLAMLAALTHKPTERFAMKFARRHYKLLIVAAACTAIGASASAIATAGAASTNTSTNSSTTSATASPKAHGAGGLLSARALARRAVHADAVVATRSGFVTVTLDRGFVQSVSGQQLTIREGTKKATYKTVTLTIPSNAKVREDRRTSSLSALTAGQPVWVLQGPNATRVIARSMPAS
jgi:hypothetical protein